VTARAIAATAIAALAVAGFLYFPGHTWLQSDTQIYVPIFEHLADPGALRHDPVATRPHVRWTLYDEIAVAARSWTGLEYKEILQIQQLLYRFAGLTGALLVGLSLTGGLVPGLLVAGCFGLGATINGPSVLTLEYEPVPRGFAILLVVFALGLASQSRWRLAGAAGALALLYHPPTAAAFWFCVILWWLSRRAGVAAPRLLAALPAGIVALAAAAMLQDGGREAPVLFGRIGAEVEPIQRLRGAYNWLSLWPPGWLWQYPLLFCVAVGAWLRLRGAMPPVLRWFSIGLPALGLLSMAVSYLLLDVGKWPLMPQLQPARNVLFITLFTTLLGAAAGWRAGARGRTWEAAGWLAVVFAIPANGLVFPLFAGALNSPLAAKRLALVVALAALGALAARLWARKPAAGGALAAAALTAAAWLIPTWGEMRNYPPLHTRELAELAAWARAATPRDAVFLFAGAHRRLEPGVFRVQAGRALYVDWKAGGQANLIEGFALEWWRRWQAVNQARPPLLPLAGYRALGIDYIVVEPAHRPPGAAPVFSNAHWEAFATG
jgi:hypothetical protein